MATGLYQLNVIKLFLDMQTLRRFVLYDDIRFHEVQVSIFFTYFNYSFVIFKKNGKVKISIMEGYNQNNDNLNFKL